MSQTLDAKNLLKLGLAELAQGRAGAATTLFEAALTAQPGYLPATKALSQAYYIEGRYAAAIDAAAHALAVEPDDASNALNLAICLFGAGRLAEAAASFARGMTSKQANLRHRLMWLYCLTRSGAYDAAIDALARIHAAGLSSPELELLDCELRQKSNAWGDFNALLAKVRAAAQLPGGFIAPSTVVGTPSLTGTDHRRIAESWTARVCDGIVPLPFAGTPKDRKIRLGYLSPDLYVVHPIGRHFQQVFAAHDRSNFEVRGYSLRPRREAGEEIYKAFDQIRFLNAVGDEAVARIIRDDDVEVLVDLGIHTDGARPRILAYRPAPIQVSCIGHGGTMGGTFMDYIITYDSLMKVADTSDFAEAPATHDDPVLSGAWNRPAFSEVSRAEFGIAEDAVVLCSFCGNYKITPDMFDLWLRLLKEVPQAVLWLRDFGPIARQNLSAHAATAGVSPTRLKFAPNEELARYFGRMRMADLFLDTHPYTASSSAADALWAGLPLITLAGETYASHMAASCLAASGLSELVTYSHDAYFAKALDLARDKPARERIRAHLLATRATSPLFDAVRYTRGLESLYRKMSQRYRAGQPPAPLRAGD